MKGTSAHVALELTHVEPVDQRSGTRKADGVWHFWERAGQRHDALKRVAQTPECRLLFLVGVKHVPYPNTSLVGEEAPHLWPAFPRDPLGFSQIPGHCATQCRVVVIPDMVALTQNKIWVSLTSRRPHTSSTRTIRDQKSQRKRSPSTAARSRAQAASGCRRARSTAVHGGAEPAVAALVGASGVKMMRWSAMLNGGVASP